MSSDLPSLLSMNQVVKLTTLSRTIINKKRREGAFPTAVVLGPKRIAFVEAEVLQWITERINRRNAA